MNENQAEWTGPTQTNSKTDVPSTTTLPRLDSCRTCVATRRTLLTQGLGFTALEASGARADKTSNGKAEESDSTTEDHPNLLRSHPAFMFRPVGATSNADMPALAGTLARAELPLHLKHTPPLGVLSDAWLVHEGFASESIFVPNGSPPPLHRFHLL